MNIELAKLCSVIKSEVDDVIKGPFDGGCVAVGEFKGLQVQIVVTTDESEFVEINPVLECVRY